MNTTPSFAFKGNGLATGFGVTGAVGVPESGLGNAILSFFLQLRKASKIIRYIYSCYIIRVY